LSLIFPAKRDRTKRLIVSDRERPDVSGPI
jgi:hypothetical protein